MFVLKCLMVCLILIGGFNRFLNAQVPLEKLGLPNENITSIGLYGNIMAVGTEGHGVFYQDLMNDSSWIHLGLDTADVYTVYPHKSGPLGWAIGAGLKPDNSYPHFVYCSFAGGPFEAKDAGINDSLATVINQLDGFPDPSICGETYAAAGGALFRRYFADTVWTPVYEATVEGYIQTVKVHEEFPGLLLAGGAEGFAGALLMKSFDYGDSWEWISPPGFVRDVDFWGDSSQTIFAVTYPFVYRSLDAGQSWTEVYNGPFIINKVLYDPVQSLVFLAGQEPSLSGDPILLYSYDVGNTWMPVQLGVTGNAIVDLKKGADGWLYFAMPDSGVFRINPVYLGSMDNRTVDVIKKYHLYQNYPNPFNSTTTITFDLPESGRVTLKVYNILGEEVSTLLSARLAGAAGQASLLSGFYEYKWDGSNFASGIYLYRLKAGDYIETKKMILIN